MRKLLPALIAIAALAACVSNSDDGTVEDAFPGAVEISPGVPATGSIASSTEWDYFKFTVPEGGASVWIQTFDSTGASCDPIGQKVDTGLMLYDAFAELVQGECVPVNKYSNETCYLADEDCNTQLTGNQSCTNDSSPLAPGWCEDFTTTLSAGVYYLGVRGFLAPGGVQPSFTYKLKVSLE
jgi:hypothetical protein